LTTTSGLRPNHSTRSSSRIQAREPSNGAHRDQVPVDDRNLYIGVVCFDSDPGNIVVSQSRRDANLEDTDSVRMLLDTFNDGQNAFVFSTNPFGIKYDGQVRAEGQTGTLGGGGVSGFNVNWDGDWMVRTRITERGWEAIPLKTLRYAPGRDRTWGATRSAPSSFLPEALSFLAATVNGAVEAEGQPRQRCDQADLVDHVAGPSAGVLL
jgi:hypothetical protein